jgi:hypothetical protein
MTDAGIEPASARALLRRRAPGTARPIVSVADDVANNRAGWLLEA